MSLSRVVTSMLMTIYLLMATWPDSVQNILAGILEARAHWLQSKMELNPAKMRILFLSLGGVGFGNPTPSPWWGAIDADTNGGEFGSSLGLLFSSGGLDH